MSLPSTPSSTVTTLPRRAFFRDVLELPWVSDAGSDEGADPTTEQSWLIFRTVRARLGVHPTDNPDHWRSARALTHHQMSLMVVTSRPPLRPFASAAA